jgi:hypothetical protein
MPRTPAFRHRHQTGSGHESLTPKRVTYAVTVDADDSPDAIAKVKNLASGRHLETIRSPLSHRNRTFLGDASPLNAVRDRCDIRNMAAIERLEGHIDELKHHLRELTLRIDHLSRESVEQKRELTLRIDHLSRESVEQKRESVEQKRELTLRIDHLSRESVEQKRRLTFQEKRHQRQIKNHQRQIKNRQRQIKNHQRQIKNHQRQIKNLKRDQKDLQDSRRKIIYREIVVCVYNALGHNPNNPPQTTFKYVRDHPDILTDVFQMSQNDIQRALEALDPRRTHSWIKVGNGEAHGFSVAEAGRLIDDKAIRILFNALTQNVENKSTTIQDASLTIHNTLVTRIPALADIYNLPNLKSGNTTSEAISKRFIEEYVDRYLATKSQTQDWPHIPPPPGVDPETYRWGQF